MNQHYVPRLYLKNFSKKNGKEYFVDVYDSQTQKTFTANIKKVCAEHDLYTLDKESDFNEDSLVFEKVYAEYIEPLLQKSYNLLTDDTISNITSQQRLVILTGILQLYYRNPHVLTDGLNRLADDISKIYSNRKIDDESFTYLNQDFKYKDWDEKKVIDFLISDMTNVFKEMHLLESQKGVDFHKDAIIEVQKIDDNGLFFTSDNPLTIEDFTTPSRDIKHKSKEFIIPLNYKYAVRIYHDKTKNPHKIYRCKIGNGNSNLINTKLFKQKIRFIIGSKDAFEQYFKMNEIFETHSVDYMIVMFRQILEKFPKTKETMDAHNVIKFYVDKYDKEGTLTNKDMREMHQILKQLGIKKRKKEI